MVVDTSGKIHISYFDKTRTTVKYATNVSDSWLISVLDNAKERDVGKLTDLVLDSSNRAHIIYCESTNSSKYYLKYATNASGVWVATTVNGSVYGKYPSIAADGAGMAHISYLDANAATLKYAINESGTWTATTVDTIRGVQGNTSIALDTSDYAHISYYNEVSHTLKYATNISGSWVITTVDEVSGGDVGRYASIALDGNGKAHISYYDATNGDLKYATNASGVWVTPTTIDSTGNVGRDTSIALDKNNKIHISYYDSTSGSGDLKYATYNSNTGVWETETIDSEGIVGSYASIAVSRGGTVFISYYDMTNTNLKYASNISGEWRTYTVDESTGDVGQYSSIALDNTGNAQVSISYYDVTNKDLKYATNDVTNEPKATTEPATDITSNSATLNGTINPNGLPSKAWFEWGKMFGGPYQKKSPKKSFKDTSDLPHSHSAQGLTESTTYYYHVVVENQDAITYGSELSFETGP